MSNQHAVSSHHQSAETKAPAADAPFEIMIDGQCSLCRREAAMMRRMDAGRGRLLITDITDPGFDPAAINRTHDEVMRFIHGRTADGQIVTGVEVFRRAYAALGRGWMAAWTGWPVIRPIIDAIYRLFARHRTSISRMVGCVEGVCGVPMAERRANGSVR